MHPVATTVPVTEPEQLACWLVTAARRWHAAEDPGATVRAVLADVATLLPPGASVSVTLLGTGRRPVAPPRDAGPAAALDALQVARREGPLLDALAGTAAGSGDLAGDLRWPALAAQVAATGVRTATCLPLDAGCGVVGALSVYATGAGPDVDRAVLVPVAGQAALALSTVRRVANLTVALDSRDLIGQAKGVLMERYRITADTAFGILVRASQDTHRKVREVAGMITETGEAPHPAPTGDDGRGTPTGGGR